MSIDLFIIILTWILGILSFIFFTPKNRRRRFIFAFLVCKGISWFVLLVETQFKLIYFPFRELPFASNVLITNGYFLYPLICGFYIISEPKTNYLFRFFYLSLWISGLTVYVELLENYTNLIKYRHFAWYWTWFDFCWIFTLTNMIYRWFFNHITLFREDKETVR